MLLMVRMVICFPLTARARILLLILLKVSKGMNFVVLVKGLFLFTKNALIGVYGENG